MLSLFQSLFDYQFVALGALRVVVALLFIAEGYQKFPKEKPPVLAENAIRPKNHICACVLSGIEFVSGLFLFAGLFTQASAIILSCVAIKRAYNQYRHKSATERNISLYILLCAISLFFLFSGPGAYGIDFPL
jgi:putative oxidoreductase